MTYPEGSLSILGFVVLFFVIVCFMQIARGVVAGLTGRQEIYHYKIRWFSLFLGFFLIYLVINWQDVSSNTLRGYNEGIRLEITTPPQ